VDLDALERNLAAVRLAAGSADVMLVVKADAYGHGAVPVAWHLTSAGGVACLGVGDSAEALELREAGVTTPILVLGAVVPGEVDAVIRGGIALTVHATDRVRSLRRAVARCQGRVAVHLKVDTGMGRLGCAPERAVGIAREIVRSRGLLLEGVATHLAHGAADEDGRRQIRRFERVLAALEAAGIRPRWRHAYASSALLAGLPAAFNLVRPGLAVYGVRPAGARPGDPTLVPALSWRTQIVFLKDHRKGAALGYGGTWTAPRRSRIATLPVGYNDGYRFAFSNKAEVLVRGRRCPVVGRVSMDYVTVDVTRVPGASVGDVVTLLGRDGDEEVGAADLAGLADTIPYEILCGIGRRVRRRYVRARSPAPSPLAVPPPSPKPPGPAGGR
jgi:alanine racemase